VPLVKVEFLLVFATEKVGWNDSCKKVPVEQFTVTVDVAFSVPSTCVTMPKFMSVTANAQVGATVSFTFNVFALEAAWALPPANRQDKAEAVTSPILAILFAHRYIF